MDRKLCTWCIIKPLESKTIGFRIFDCECTHKGSNRFYATWTLMAQSVAIIALSGYLAYKQLPKVLVGGYIFAFDNKCAISFSCLIYPIFQAFLLTPLNYHLRIREIDVLDKIFRESHSCGALDLAYKDLDSIKRVFAWGKNIWIGGIVYILLVCILDHVIFGSGDYIEKGCIFFASHIFVITVLQVAGEVTIYRTVSSNGANVLKKSFSLRLRHPGGFHTFFGEDINNYIRLSAMVKKGVGLYASFMVSYSGLTAYANIIIGLVVQNAILLDLVTKSSLSLHQYKMGILIVSSVNWGLVLLCVVLKYVDTLADPGIQLGHYLFRFPISKLSKLEASQVEILFYVLTDFRPDIKVHGLIRLGVGLISHITALVIKFIFVVLQFPG